MSDAPHDHDHHHRRVQGGQARAAVFGASDGLVSTMALVLGVAGADSEGSFVRVAGLAGLVAGAVSMAAGEYVSMRAQTELIQRELEIERRELERHPERETAELGAVYEERGLDPETARALSEQVMQQPEVALEVHAREELGVDPNALGSPVGAAVSSFVSFACGGLVPLLPWLIGSGDAAVVASAVLGVTAAAVIGFVLARFTDKSVFLTSARQVAITGGAALLTWLIGRAVGIDVSG